MFSMKVSRGFRGAVAAAGVSFVLFAGACGSTQTVADSDVPDVIQASGVVMSVEGLGCPMCAESIAVSLKNVDGVTGSKVNLDDGTVDVEFAPAAEVSRSALARAVTDGGFTYRGLRVKE
jgi:copper chaperone CopZ